MAEDLALLVIDCSLELDELASNEELCPDVVVSVSEEDDVPPPVIESAQ